MATLKARKTAKNQPNTFDEVLAPSLSQPIAATTAPTLAHTRFHLSDQQLKWGIGLAWAAAMIVGGIGVGRFILDAKTTTSSSEPAPVATAAVRSASPANYRIGSTAAKPSQTRLVVQPLANPTSAAQAVAGTPLTMASASFYQPAAASDALQPGFQYYGHAQGSTGTAPVR